MILLFSQNKHGRHSHRQEYGPMETVLFGEATLMPMILVFADCPHNRDTPAREAFTPTFTHSRIPEGWSEQIYIQRAYEFHGSLERVLEEGQDWRVIIQRNLIFTEIFNFLKRYLLGLSAHSSINSRYRR